MEGHAQIGDASHTKKRYGKNAFDKNIMQQQNVEENVG